MNVYLIPMHPTYAFYPHYSLHVQPPQETGILGRQNWDSWKNILGSYPTTSLLSTIRLLCKFPFLNDDNEGNDDILIENNKNIVITMLESLNEVISFSMNVSAPQLFLTIVFFYNNRDDKH